MTQEQLDSYILVIHLTLTNNLLVEDYDEPIKSEFISRGAYVPNQI